VIGQLSATVFRGCRRRLHDVTDRTISQPRVLRFGQRRHAVNDHEIGGLQELADFDPAERRRRGHALETP